MQPIYLDHAATTMPRPEVVAAMAPFAEERFGNPSSAHRWGREAKAALEEARERLAAVLGAVRGEIVFTAGGTEADNLAILGRYRHVARARGEASAPVVCSAIEHKAVLNATDAAARAGARRVVLPVSPGGVVELEAVDEALGLRPAVVSVMWGNNEVGTLQPVGPVAERCATAGVVFHTDAVQALGRTRVRVDEVPCGLLSLSAHKFGGPRGMGALFVRSGVEIEPLWYGGGQEHALRPGTHNVAGAVGLAVAAELAAGEQVAESERLARLRDELEAALEATIPELNVNGRGSPRLPHITNLSIPGVDQEVLLMALDLEGIAVSSGSACQSGAVEPSHVLAAMQRAVPGQASIRFSLGRSTTQAEVREVIRKMPEVVRRVGIR